MALRLGFREIDGFREEWAKVLMEHRGAGFAGIDEFARCTELPKRALILLAEADAFRSVGADRREALWAVRRLPDDDALPLFAARKAEEQAPETRAALPTMPLSEHVLADYQTMGLSLKGYPMQFLRDLFRAEGVMSCADIAAAKDGQRVALAGVVLVRQMPGDAGVVFITLSDETGIANAVVWPAVFERYRREVMGARLLLIAGKIQRSPEDVVHLVSERFWDRTHELSRLSEDAQPQSSVQNHLHKHPRNVRVLQKSRDFH